MVEISGSPAVINDRFVSDLTDSLLDELVAVTGVEKDVFYYDDTHIMFEYNRTRGTVIIATFDPRYVAAVRLALTQCYGPAEGKKATPSQRQPRKVVREKGVIARDIGVFPFWRSLGEWKADMDSDPKADEKIAMASHRFNRSKGQFSRYDYEGYPHDYIFKTTTADKLAMYIGYYRMIPVNGARGFLRDLYATLPMCLQLEVLMEGY